jgi:hypothetical protein
MRPGLLARAQLQVMHRACRGTGYHARAGRCDGEDSDAAVGCAPCATSHTRTVPSLSPETARRSSAVAASAAPVASSLTGDSCCRRLVY